MIFTVPTKQRKKESNNADYWVLLFPLIIACMFPVKDENCIFKTEYILPQLLTEWVIIRNQNNNKDFNNEETLPMLGIIYTSSHHNNDFPFSSEKLNNLAIPVINSLKGRYCSELSEMFLLSKPTYYEIEELLASCTPCTFAYDEDIQPKYEFSIFGKMEDYLSKKVLFKVNFK